MSGGLTAGAALGHAGHPKHRFPVSHKRHGYDVSWPQCRGRAAHHMPGRRASFVILGLTNGSGHTVNPCLRSQRAWARAHHVPTSGYLVPSYPDRAQRRAARRSVHGHCRRTPRCVLHRDGVLQARDALATMRATHLHASRVWVDVEFRHYHPWTHRRHANAAVVKGVVHGLRRAHMPLGVYTTSYMWHAIVGGYRLHVPNWLPVGHGGPRRALGMCRTSATGGKTWIAQYTRALDSDLTCPTLSAHRRHRSALWPFRHTTQQLLSKGRPVRLIQRRLGIAVTGTFDAPTVLAVTRWQRNHALPATGRITPTDWRALGAYRMRGSHGPRIGRFARQP